MRCIHAGSRCMLNPNPDSKSVLAVSNYGSRRRRSTPPHDVGDVRHLLRHCMQAPRWVALHRH